MATTEDIEQPKYVDFAEYILFQVQRTQALVRQTDLMLLVSTVVAAVVFLIFGFVLVDHWGFSQGVSAIWRWVGFCLLVSICAGGMIYFLLTAAGKNVTRLFAAKTLENADQTLSNNLMTLIDLDQHGRSANPLIRNSLEKRAAISLNDLDVDHAVDRRALLNRLYILLAGTVLLFGYAFFTPKSVTDSLSRMLFPWTTAVAPTQTRILDVQPGNATVTAGSHTEVTAYIEGKIPEQVWLVYSTADQRVVDERVELVSTGEGLGKYTGIVTGENGRGVDQTTKYYLEAGDGRSPQYTLQVQPAPHAVIKEIMITPPPYSELPERTQSIGTLDALEGSQVVLSAKTNIHVEKAWIQLFDSEDPTDRAGQLPLTIESGRKISGNWTLKIQDDGTYARFYRIECETAAGSRDPNPPLNAILIRPDERPNIRLLDPSSDLTRPVNATVPLLIEASDPDFRLSGLSVQVEKHGQLIGSELIDARNQSTLRVTHRLELSRLPLEAGEEIVFWVEARDNRQPRPNSRNSSKLRIRLTEPVNLEKVEEQLAEDEERQQQENPEEAAPEEANQPEEMAAENSDQTSENEAEQEKRPSEEMAPGEEGGTEEQPTSNAQEQKPGEGKQSDQKNETGNESEQEGEQSKPEEQFSPDGEDDDLVLEKLMEKLKEQQQKKQQEQKENPDSDPQQGEQQPDSAQQPDKASNPEETSENPEMQPDSTSDQNSQSSPDNKGEQPPSENSSAEKTSPEEMAKPDENSSMPDPEQSNPEGKNPESQQPDSNAEQSSEEMKNSESSDSPKSDQQQGPGEANPSEQMQPGEGKGEQSEKTEQGPANKVDPNQDQLPGDMPRPAEENDPEGKGKPGEKPGEGEAKPGEGDEKGPAERDDMPNPDSPDAQNPQDVSNDPNMQKPSGDPQKKPGQNSQKSDEPPPSESDPTRTKPDGSQNPPQTNPDPASDPGEMKPSQNKGAEDQTGDQKSPTGKPNSSSNEQAKPDSQPSKVNPENSAEEMPSPEQEGNPETSQAEEQEGMPGEGEQGKGEQSDQQPGEGEGEGEGKSEEAGKNKGKGNGPGKPGQGRSDEPGTPSNSSGSGTPKGSTEETGTDPGGVAEGDQAMQPNANQPQGESDESAAQKKPTAEALEDRKKAAELVLNQLEEDLKRGDVSQEMLDELGWTKDNLKQFQQRLADYLRADKENTESALKQQQFNEMLRNMRLEGQRNERTGQDVRIESRDEFAPSLAPAPPEYRELEQAFRRSLSGAEGKPQN